MSIYVDEKIIDPQARKVKTLLRWHDTVPQFAVVSHNPAEEAKGVVGVYHANGSIVKSDVTARSASSPVTCIEWHPAKHILYVGYENGDISLWNKDSLENDVVFSKHLQAITVLRCHENGLFLISCDSCGCCTVWKVNITGALVLLSYQDLREPICDAVFRTISSFEEERLHSSSKVDDRVFDTWNNPDHEHGKYDIAIADDDRILFYAGGLSGLVSYFDENGHWNNQLHLSSAVKLLLYYKEKDLLILITESLSLSQYRISRDGGLTETFQIKLTGSHLQLGVTWIGNETLAVSTSERTVYIWNIRTGHTSNQSLNDYLAVKHKDKITSISYCSHKDILSVGTDSGHVLSWKNCFAHPHSLENDNWHMDQLTSIQGHVNDLQWSKQLPVLILTTSSEVFVLQEQNVCFHFTSDIFAVQVEARQLFLESAFNQEIYLHLITEKPITGVYLQGVHVGLACGNQLMFYEVNFQNKATNHIGTFTSESRIVELHEQSVYVAEGSIIEIRTFQGTLKQTLSFLSKEGKVILLNVFEEFLIAATDMGIVKIWDISRREAKLHFGPKSFESISEEKQMSSIKCNHLGNKFSFNMKKRTKAGFTPDSILFVFDIDSDMLLQFEFKNGKAAGENSDILIKANLQPNPDEHLFSGRYPAQHFWITDDPRLIICEAKPLPEFSLKQNKVAERTLHNIPPTSKPEHEGKSAVFSFYVVPEYGLLIQEYFCMLYGENLLAGVFVPFFYVLKSLNAAHVQEDSVIWPNVENQKPSYESPIIRKVMRDFTGMADCDNTTKEALMKFSYNLSAGNMDEAFRVIRVIKNECVWNNLLVKCIKTKRLDVAKVCLGKLRLVSIIMALQEAEHEPHDVKVGILAVYLYMTSDAEQIFTEAKRFDLLNTLYQDTNQWDKALEIAEKFDRIHLKNTYYNYGKQLEFVGDIFGAIEMYEKAEVQTSEITRVLFGTTALEKYILQSKNRDMCDWWGQFLESDNDMESAIEFYGYAEDYHSLARVYSYCSNVDKAAELAIETGDKAACFQVGRDFENQGNIKEAVNFFTRAKAYNNAIRLCKDNDLENQLMSLALMSGPEDKVEVAKYYEKQDSQQDKAIMLYYKANLITKAMELAFRSQEYGTLLAIADDLPNLNNPELLIHCAQILLEIKKYDKAVNLLAQTDRQKDALKLCLEHNVCITEELAEKLSPSKDHHSRLEVLEQIADSCAQQENYHLAAKKYTQAGKRIKAMKALLKSGDTEKIIFFASVSRQKEIYVMAANYLQSLNWRCDAEIMKNIKLFYSKAKCLDLLSSFYEACAQDEIDEYQNYEKALEALLEASKCLKKADANEVSRQMQKLEYKIDMVKQFVNIRMNYKTAPGQAIDHCRDLLKNENVEVAVRRGDIYGFCVEHYCKLQNYKAAYEILLEMKKVIPQQNIEYYIKADHLERITTVVGVNFIDQRGHKMREDNEVIFDAIEDNT